MVASDASHQAVPPVGLGLGGSSRAEETELEAAGGPHWWPTAPCLVHAGHECATTTSSVCLACEVPGLISNVHWDSIHQRCRKRKWGNQAQPAVALINDTFLFLLGQARTDTVRVPSPLCEDLGPPPLTRWETRLIALLQR